MAISPLLIALLPVALFVYTYTRSAGKKQNYPDGPKPLPLLGNALQLAKEPQLWLTVHEWAKKYGTSQILLPF
jgi:cytochrome P450 family 33